jgi:hypothetical protein
MPLETMTNSGVTCPHGKVTASPPIGAEGEPRG